MQVKNTEKILIGLCVFLLFLFLLSIIVVTFTRQVLVKRMGIHNAFTDFVFMDNDDFNNGDDFQNSSTNTNINWAEIYPFFSEDIPIESNEVETETLVDVIESKINNIEYKIDTYTSSALFGYKKFVELSCAFDELIDWNFASFAEYNGVVELPDGYWTVYTKQKDITEHANALIELNEFCKNNGCEFLYIQAPYKVCEYEDIQISGTSDYSNQNANQLLTALNNADVDVFDIRQSIHAEGYSHHEMFYRTDHHWLTTTGLWAAQKTLEYCNEKYGFSAETSRLSLDMFEQKLYSSWFLGSHGKKATLARTEPDDFILLYPKYETKFHYYVPAESIDAESDYSIIYDMEQIDSKDYYNLSPYGGYNHGNQPLVKINNQLDADDKKILIIHDSFGISFTSCLALCEAQVDSLDIRYFTGSVKNYIEQTNPDIVMVMYHAGTVGGEINWSTHKDEFDFR